MNKTLFLISILLVLIAIGVWVYLFFYGKPSSVGDVFADLGFGGPAPTFNPVQDDNITSDNVIVRSGLLRQVTTRPVVGATIMRGTIRFVERGTGHVYDVSLQNGGETLIQNTTIPKTIQAVFAPSGQFVAITSETETGVSSIVTPVARQQEGNGVAPKSIPLGAREISFSTDGELLYYLLPTDQGSAGYAYHLQKETNIELFAIPLREVRVLWGTPLYVYTTPTGTQRGGVYKVENNSLRYVTPSEVGIQAVRAGSRLVFTASRSGSPSSYTSAGNDNVPIPVIVVPEKCTTDLSASSTLYCGVPYSGNLGELFPDQWYQGGISYADALMKIDVENRTTSMVSNLSRESGREIDVMNIGMSDDRRYLYFINKNDESLWVYELTR